MRAFQPQPQMRHIAREAMQASSQCRALALNRPLNFLHHDGAMHILFSRRNPQPTGSLDQLVRYPRTVDNRAFDRIATKSSALTKFAP